MAYQKINFLDQNVERPRTYEFQENQDGTTTLVDSFGIITELGTPINAENMNHIEDGIISVENDKMNKDFSNATSQPWNDRLKTDLSNATSTSKSVSISWGMPNYSSGVNIYSGWTANKYGIIKFFGHTSNSDGIFAYVNGVEVARFSGWSYGGKVIQNTAIFPISQGEIYTATATGDASVNAVFYPYKGE